MKLNFKNINDWFGSVFTEIENYIDSTLSEFNKKLIEQDSKLDKGNLRLEKIIVESNKELARLIENQESLKKEVLLLKENNKKEAYNTILKLSSEVESLKQKVDNLENIIRNTKLSRDQLLKTLSSDGCIDLRYNLKLTPRVLPEKAQNGMIAIDAKDGKLKYYNNKWI